MTITVKKALQNNQSILQNFGLVEEIDEQAAEIISGGCDPQPSNNIIPGGSDPQPSNNIIPGGSNPQPSNNFIPGGCNPQPINNINVGKIGNFNNGANYGPNNITVS